MSRRNTATLIALAALTSALVAAPVSAYADPSAPVASPYQRCENTTPPSWFYPDSTNAAQADSSIPNSWGSSINMARLVCAESSYETDANLGSYYGLGQLSKGDVSAANITWDHYENGSSNHSIRYFQMLAAFRYLIAHGYSDPADAWNHEVNYGWW